MGEFIPTHQTETRDRVLIPFIVGLQSVANLASFNDIIRSEVSGSHRPHVVPFAMKGYEFSSDEML